MKPRELLATAQIPDGDELRLYKRDTDFIITLGSNELMSSRSSGSEEALALMTIERLKTEAPHLLIGGYGMGFTLRAALARLDAKTRFTVAELVPEIIDWARGSGASTIPALRFSRGMSRAPRDLVSAGGRSSRRQGGAAVAPHATSVN